MKQLSNKDIFDITGDHSNLLKLMLLGKLESISVRDLLESKELSSVLGIPNLLQFSCRSNSMFYQYHRKILQLDVEYRVFFNSMRNVYNSIKNDIYVIQDAKDYYEDKIVYCY